MARGTVNKVILIGRLGKDPEMKYAPSGTAIATFNMATNERTKDQDGNFTDHTDWHRVVAFGRTAEVAGEYLVKGKLAYVEGRIQTRSWDDQNGQKRYTTEIVCNNLQLLGSRGDVDDKAEVPTDTTTEQADSDQTENTVETDKDDDLPF
jgi:single-strand DNA-binding protein